MTGLRYLQGRSRSRSALDLGDQRYAAVRDAYVVSFRYHTARAYGGDLDHLFDWAQASDRLVLDLTAEDIGQYAASLHGRYRPNTIIRKRTALRGFYDLAVNTGAIAETPMHGWAWRRREWRSPRPREHS